MKTKIFISLLFTLLYGISSYTQVEDYHYRRELSGIQDTWHKIHIPIDIYSSTQTSLNDIRILGFTEENDTIEAPFLLKKQLDEHISLKIPFRLMNQVKSDGWYFTTIATRKPNPINIIYLDLSEENYNLSVRLEGSNNLYHWSTITDNYRIIGISNDFVEYEFKKIIIPDTQFKFYRVSWKSDKRIKILSAKLRKEATIPGNTSLLKNTYQVTEDDKSKLTIIDLNMKDVAPISKLTIVTANSYDFYRPISIQTVTDSVKQNDNWKVYYTDHYQSVLSSLEEPTYEIPEITTNKLRVLIYNNDNEPLTIKNITVESTEYSLETRFNKKAQYYMYYGNPLAIKPKYDLKYFDSIIPDSMKVISLGKPELLIKPQESKLVKSIKKLWIWIIMGIIVIVLGAFTINMIKNTKNA